MKTGLIGIPLTAIPLTSPHASTVATRLPMMNVRMPGASICEVGIQNLHMPVGEIVPEFDGEFAADVNFHATTSGVTFNEVGELGGKRCNFTEALEEIGLLLRAKRP